jgi:hypothetical protein
MRGYLSGFAVTAAPLEYHLVAPWLSPPKDTWWCRALWKERHAIDKPPAACGLKLTPGTSGWWRGLPTSNSLRMLHGTLAPWTGPLGHFSGPGWPLRERHTEVYWITIDRGSGVPLLLSLKPPSTSGRTLFPGMESEA